MTDLSNTTVYQEALQTYRSTTSAVVSSASGLLTGALILVGFAVERNSEILLAVAVVPMLAMWTLFRRWQWISRQCTIAAKEAEDTNRTELVKLFTDRLDRFMGADTPAEENFVKRVFTLPARSKSPDGRWNSYGSALVVSMPFWAAAVIGCGAAGFGLSGWWEEVDNLEGLRTNAKILCETLPTGQTTVQIEAQGLQLTYPCLTGE